MCARYLAKGLAAMTVSVVLGGCSPSGAPLPPSAKLLEGLPAVTARVASATGYPTEALEVLAGAAHLRVSVKDAKLATADQATRENAAIQIVAAIEKGIESRSEFSSIQEISVAIIHPAEGGESAEDSHVEDVMQFRKAPSGRFVHHIT
jgi:hypothetical protein